MRILIAALFGAIVLFLWSFVAHTMLPIGEMGIKQPANEDVVLQAVNTGLPTPGIYLLPSMDMSKWGDEAAMKAYVEKSKGSQFAFVVLAPSVGDPTDMTQNLIKQFVNVFLASVIAAWLLAATNWGFGARVIGATAMGIFAWLAVVVPMWNWYRFPTDFMIGGLIEHGVGWLLAGVVIAWWIGRKQPRRY